MSTFWDFQDQMRKRREEPPPGTPPSSGKPPAEQPLTISQLTGQIERALRDGLPQSLLVKGEVSNFNHHRGSGHCYFTLKDTNACIDCVMFKSDFVRVKFTPADGMELLARGRIAVYPQRGRYQLYVTRLEPLGQGALELAFKQLCAKLQAEGLFAPERKKPLPRYPLRIALVTSTQTAALQDMLKVLRRFKFLNLFVYHVPVQGEGSAERIASALRDLSQRSQSVSGIDLVILGRGGGSLEDLWEFNEEIVARAIVACSIPVITGIGHEVDVSVADLVADYHAHTPTEAAQVATAQWRTVADTVDQLGIRLRRELRTLLQDARQRLAQIARHELFRRPLDRLLAARQLLDDRQRAMTLAIAQRLRRLEDRLARLTASFRERHPRHAIAIRRQQVMELQRRLSQSMQNQLTRRRQAIAALSAHLNAVGPEQVLRRGYTITTLKRNGAVVRDPRQLKEGDRLVTRFADGTTESTVVDSRQLGLFET